jgi:hypothetical protein
MTTDEVLQKLLTPPQGETLLAQKRISPSGNVYRWLSVGFDTIEELTSEGGYTWVKLQQE